MNGAPSRAPSSGSFRQHSHSSTVSVLREFAEDGAKINLPVAERAEAPSPVDPGFEAAVHTLAPSWPELGILHMEGLDAVVIQIDVFQVVKLLQHKMTGVIQQAGALVLPGALIGPIGSAMADRLRCGQG